MPTEILRLMDLNMWEMHREMTRVAKGGELREPRALTMIAVPHSVAWRNLVHVRGPIDPEVLVREVREFYVQRGMAFGVNVRAHADQVVEEALRARGFDMLVANPGMALREDPGTDCRPPGLEVRRLVRWSLRSANATPARDGRLVRVFREAGRVGRWRSFRSDSGARGGGACHPSRALRVGVQAGNAGQR